MFHERLHLNRGWHVPELSPRDPSEIEQVRAVGGTPLHLVTLEGIEYQLDLPLGEVLECGAGQDEISEVQHVERVAVVVAGLVPG